MDLKIKFNVEKNINKNNSNDYNNDNSILSKTKQNIGIKKVFYSLLVILVVIAYIYYVSWIILVVS